MVDGLSVEDIWVKYKKYIEIQSLVDAGPLSDDGWWSVLDLEGDACVAEPDLREDYDLRGDTASLVLRTAPFGFPRNICTLCFKIPGTTTTTTYGAIRVVLWGIVGVPEPYGSSVSGEIIANEEAPTLRVNNKMAMKTDW